MGFFSLSQEIVTTPTTTQHNTTQHNTLQHILYTVVGLDTKMALHTTPPHPPPQKLNVSNISAVTDPILMKL